MTAVDSLPASFEELGLAPFLLQTLTEMEYDSPTPVQARTIPALLEGRDLIGQAQTGSGKTAAFGLPMLHRLAATGKVQGLILTPTRELALQVAGALEGYAKRIPRFSIAAVYGGAPMDAQFRALKRGVDIVVGTPGRIIDHLERGSLVLDNVRMAVLDEADQMLKMGFIEDVEHILSHIPEDSQRVLFSATMPDPIYRIAKRSLRNPVTIEIESSKENLPNIVQRMIRVRDSEKVGVLCGLLEVTSFDAAIIFARTQVRCTEIAERLLALGFPAESLHGGMNQSMRERVIQRLRDGKSRIVVATDVAARGLDVERITHVINLDIPFDVESYVHRIGRTGRAGREGASFLFVTPPERRLLMAIERYTNQRIEMMDPPSERDVAAARARQFLERLKVEQQNERSLASYETLFTSWCEELQVEPARLGAILIRMSAGDRTLEMPREPEFRRPERAERPNDRFDRPERSDRFERPDRFERTDRFDRQERPAPVRPERFERAPMADRETGAPSRADRDADFVHPAGPPVHLPADPGMVRLFLSAGRRNAVTPSMVVAALANSSGIDGRDIGRIEVHDRNTFVDVRQEVAHAVLAVEQLAMGNRLAVIKVARPDSDSDRPSAPPMRVRPGGFSASQRPATWGAKPAPVAHRKGPSRPKR